MFFSIIVPVYNSEKYLSQCIESVLSQSYSNFELILVDDSSTDSSFEICQLFANKDARINVIHKENGGTSSARNVGLNNAKGDYILFMDNDDYWNNSNALSLIANHLEESKADVLIFDYISYYQNKDKFVYNRRKCNRKHLLSLSVDDALKEIIKNNLLHVTVWTKVVKASIIKENNIYFPEGMRNEDTDWIGNLLHYINSVDYCENLFYVYRKGTGSAQTDTPPTFEIITDLSKIIKKHIFNSSELSHTRQDILFNYLAYPYAVWMAQICSVNSLEAKEQFQAMKEYTYLFKYDLNPYVNIVAKVYRIFRYKITAKILYFYLYHR